jgi:alkanesulfonate monooxygenase SsuD/methylene tetrahydromethanopterin reductase-like flavin-dependent oxidoreductase (luciferase family)
MHCEQLGRDYSNIRRTTSTICVIGDSEETALASLSEQQRSLVSMMQANSLIGTPESMRKRIADYAEAGVQELILWFPDAAKLESLRQFAREFIQR